MQMGITVVLMDPEQELLDTVPAGSTLKVGFPIAEGQDPTGMAMREYDPLAELWTTLEAEEVDGFMEAFETWPGTTILSN